MPRVESQIARTALSAVPSVGRSLRLIWAMLVLATLAAPIAGQSATAADAGSPEAGAPLPPAADAKIDLNRDVRPILSGHCFQCHGPDARARQAELRLDVAAEAVRDRGGHAAIVPGSAASSALVARITSADPAERMPPAEAHRDLSAEQIAVLTRWIEQGAEYLPHWSLIAPRRADPPEARDAAWVRNPIDRFVLARLERQGWHPAPEADRETLLRRVTLDLTGLPPTLDEIDAFLLDNRADALERVVDRLLASPRYGERMAVPWLDAARYADTHGYQDDGERHMWPWRDWVIEAFNCNLPFDRFTIEQLAGDLLPGATRDQRIATGFNRNHRGNGEGGIIPEEYLVEYAVDRVETTATVWLGLTLGCARCHDHKFDPLTQREFYQLLAYFNSIPELGRVVKHGNSPPWIKAPSREQQERLAELDVELAAAQTELARIEPDLAAAQSAWEASFDRGTPVDWSYDDGLVLHYPFDGTPTSAIATKAESRFVDGGAVYVDGALGQALALDGRRYLEAGDVADFDEHQKFSYGAWVLAEGGGTVLSRMDEQKRYEGYDLRVVDGQVHVYMGSRFLDDSIRVETVQPLAAGQWHHLMVTYDGTRQARSLRIYVDGQPAELAIRSDSSNNTFRTKQPLRIGSRGSEDRFRGAIDDVRIYGRELSAAEVLAVAAAEPIQSIVALPPAARTAPQTAKLRAYYLAKHASAAHQGAYQRAKSLAAERRQADESAATVMVMQELDQPRETFVLLRGEYDKPGERVERGVPACLPPLPEAAANDRLRLARWLVDPAHPLTARVAVNRFWQLYFDTGLVKTSEDFGSQGEPPSHPELLDWLATEFIRIGWDTKGLQRLIVTSATYRQSAAVDSRQAALDPDNRLLARGARFRLPAGTIRDHALAAAGLLVERVGGPSVKPYQPPGLWEELTAAKYEQDHGESLYRRSMYTFWKRTIAPPGMMQLDASSRETCVVRPQRTNTPLQALTTLNDVTYVEAARGLAQRMLRAGGSTAESRIATAFRLVTGRRPSGEELRLLVASLAQQRARYTADGDAARRLASVGEFKADESLDAADLAAYTALAGVLLNLDEAMTRP